MSTPKISIIIVVFNAVTILENTIKSVLNQSYKNLELIIVDGGSSDGTLDIIKKTSSSKLFWISEPDKGIYDAMNKGIKMATGEFVYFLGADDTFYDDKVLETIFSDPVNYKYDLLYGNVYALALKRKYDGEFTKDKILFQNVSHQAIFYRKKIHQVVGYYNEKFKTFADWNINIECFFHSDIKVKYIDIIIANFAAGGLGTSQPDLLFLRDYLFPRNLRELYSKGIKSLKNVYLYDQWWRLIRSLRFGENDIELNDYYEAESLPLILKEMYAFQKRIPSRMIYNGIVSKTAMIMSYCMARLKNKFED
ncbi:MAG: glycosyltransferase family 2 protein [Ginsengibacter sp.]